MSTSKSTATPEFTGLRATFWPIHNYELKKVLPLALMMFCVLINYTLVRNIKDGLIMAEAGGAATISYVKSFGTFPVAILFFILYTKLATVFDKRKLFYICVVPFLVFFAAFGFVIYPNLHYLQPSSATVEALCNAYPHFKGLIRMFGCWGPTTFYIMAELWGSVVLSLLFWQFANQITRVSEAKRIYSFIAMIANTGLIACGAILTYFSQMALSYPKHLKHLGWQNSLYYILTIFSVLCVILLYAFYWMQKNVLTDPKLYDPAEIAPKKKKVKLSFWESLKVVLTSKYLLLLTVLVVSYGITINFVELSYKDQIMRTAPIGVDKNAYYNAFTGKMVLISAFVNIGCMFIGSIIVRRTKWRFAAAITPLTIGITGIIFFAVASAANIAALAPLVMSITTAPALFAAYVGAWQNLIAKGTKYTLFDATKEMSYIPLDDTLKVQGKAAVDVIGGRAGKAGGGFIQAFLFSAVAAHAADQMLAIRPYVFGLFLILIVAWLYAVAALSKMFEKANKDLEERKRLEREGDSSGGASPGLQPAT